jgi:hypothetical protein
MPINFDTDERGLHLFRDLRADVEADAQRLTQSLAIFLRIVVTENGGGTRWRDFNRYDLLNPIPVPPGFPILRHMFGTWSTIEDLDTTRFANEDALPIESFLASPIISNGSRLFSAQDFVIAIAYHRGLHNAPDDPALAELYSAVVLQAPHWAARLLRSIARAIVRAYSQPYEHFATAHGDMTNHLKGRTPRIFTNGQLEKDGAIYDNSYHQLPLPLRDGDGLRVSLRLKIIELVGTGGFIFAAGHREPGSLCIWMKHSGTRLVVEVVRAGAGRSHQMLANATVEIVEHMTTRHFVIEVAYYRRGFLVVAIDEWIKAHELVSDSPCLRDGKFILGANLEGERGAVFQLESTLIERIRNRATTSISYTSCLRRLPPYESSDLSPRAFQRPNRLAVSQWELPST